MKTVDNGKTGVSMEILMRDYLAMHFGNDNVKHEPGKFPSRKGVTCPDILVKGNRNLFIDVTISALPVGEWLVRSDPKKEQRKMFNDPINSDTDLGIAVYQQVIMLPEGYLLVANLINEAMMTRMFSAEAQSIVDSFCYHYPYQILNAFNNDWDITANNLRHVLLK